MSEKKHDYVDVKVAFDIETTSYRDEGEKRAIVYTYAFAVEDDVTVLRTEQEFVEFVSTLTETYNVNLDNRLAIYVHNLAYEWQFIKASFEWSDAFANGSDRNIIRATTTTGVEFRCSYALTNLPLAVVGEQVGVAKMLGDLDYDLLRHSETPLTAEEMGYIENDVKIIIALLRDRMRDDDFRSLPMTKTGYVRRLMVRETVNERGDAARTYRSTMRKLNLTPEYYSVARQAFQGGYTHANAQCNNETMENVVAYDLSSSYPSSINQFTYPTTKFKSAGNPTPEQLQAMLESFACLIDVTFYGLEALTAFPPISKSKAQGLSLADRVDNGRVFTADSVRVLITEVDWQVINRAYDYDNFEIHNLHYAKKDYLPTELIRPILNLYRDKTVLKGVAGKEDEYKSAKENINSVYGMIATDPVRDSFELEGREMERVHVPLQESLDDYNKSHKRFLYYPWGVWVTAYSRAVLQHTIYDLEDAGVTVAYCDTDSIYAINHEAIEPIIKASTDAIMARQYEAMAHHGFSDEEARELIEPKDKHGITHPLGAWDCETADEPISQFKTLGAKRYAKAHKGKFSVTVAGLSKRAAGYIEENGGMDFFTEDMIIPPDHSGRITHTYSEGTIKNYLTDHLGNTAYVEQTGYIHLEASEYNLTISDEYAAFIELITTP